MTTASGAERWSSRAGFTLATIGSAVGIGSIWKFPYELGAHGGGTFVVFYIAGLIVIVVPLMFAEFAIGRRGRGDPVTSIAAIAASEGAGRWWGMVGVLGVVTGFLILSFYSVIGGWTLGYTVQTVVDGLAGADPGAVRARFDAFLASPLRMLVCHALFMAATAVVVARGIANGIEAASKVMMPLLMVLMLALAAYSIAEGDLARTLAFLLRPDPAYFRADVALDALGLGFFSIGVGMGLMITYAAYGRTDISLTQVAVISVFADTGISFLAGLAVFPIVFAYQLDPASGAGLVFITLPIAFAQMPFGTTAAVAFFLLLFVAALASAIATLELVVALLIRRFAFRRFAATACAGLFCFLAGVATVLSFNVWSAWYPLEGIAGFETSTFYDMIDYLTSNILLPVDGLFIALFAGWAVPRRILVEELRLAPASATVLQFLLRYVVPAGIATATLSLLVRG